MDQRIPKYIMQLHEVKDLEKQVMDSMTTALPYCSVCSVLGLISLFMYLGLFVIIYIIRKCGDL